MTRTGKISSPINFIDAMLFIQFYREGSGPQIKTKQKSNRTKQIWQTINVFFFNHRHCLLVWICVSVWKKFTKLSLIISYEHWTSKVEIAWFWNQGMWAKPRTFVRTALWVQFRVDLNEVVSEFFLFLRRMKLTWSNLL